MSAGGSESEHVSHQLFQNNLEVVPPSARPRFDTQTRLGSEIAVQENPPKGPVAQTRTCFPIGIETTGPGLALRVCYPF